MNCNTTHYRANSSSVPGDPTEADLSKGETNDVIALLLSKALQRNLEGAADVWIMPHKQLERLRTRAGTQDKGWDPTSVSELYQQTEALTEEHVALQTLRTFSLLRDLHPPQTVSCKFENGRLNSQDRRSGAIFPVGLVYGISAVQQANEILQKLFEADLLSLVENSIGKQDLEISREGSRVVDSDAPVGFELKGFIRELEESRQHPLPDMLEVTHDEQFAVILGNRWKEADVCHRAGSYFAATVVIGSVLEGCLLARIRFAIKLGHDFKKLPEGKSKNADDWGLANLLAVSSQEGWIRAERHKLGHILKDSRNLVHPANIVTVGAEIDERSTRTYWEILQGVVEDLVKSYP